MFDVYRLFIQLLADQLRVRLTKDENRSSIHFVTINKKKEY